VLNDFILLYRAEILALTREKVAVRMAPRPTEAELETGVPLFLEQLMAVLKAHEVRGAISDPELGRAAASHGASRMRIGFTVDQLVHDYGDVCQAITELAVDLDKTISPDDFRTLNKCLDFAIAQAVTEFERQRARQQSEQENERTGFLAHELNNLVSTAKLTFHVLKQGKVGVGGSTGAARRDGSGGREKVPGRLPPGLFVFTRLAARSFGKIAEATRRAQAPHGDRAFRPGCPSRARRERRRGRSPCGGGYCCRRR